MQRMDLSRFGSIPFDHGVLMSLFDQYKAPNDKIYNLLKTGNIIKLKKGLYVTGDNERITPLNYKIIANALYGPSYVSIDTALAYYGIIPESVTIVQSITTKRSKSFRTPVGYFEYKYATKDYFPVGVLWLKTNDNESFQIASPEKALCDKIVYSKNINPRSVRNLFDYLFEDLRCDEEQIAQFNLDIIQNCAVVSKKKNTLNLLIKLIQKL